jgi:hypothetical protein
VTLEPLSDSIWASVEITRTSKPNLPTTDAIIPAGPYGTQVLMSIGYGGTGT